MAYRQAMTRKTTAMAAIKMTAVFTGPSPPFVPPGASTNTKDKLMTIVRNENTNKKEIL